MFKNTTKNKYCCVYGCQKTKESNPECTFNPLPTDPVRLQEWLKVIGRSDLTSQTNLNPKSFHVCSTHFEDEDLKFTGVLRPDALPSQHLPEQAFIDDTLDTPESNQVTNSSLIWRNVNLVSPSPDPTLPENQKVSYSTTDKSVHNDVSLGSQDELTKNMDKLTKDLDAKDRSSEDFLFYALNLYLLNPQIYCFIRGKLNLPSENALRRVKLNLSSKLDKRVLDCLSSKLKSFPDKAKYCTVCIEALNVKNNVYYDILRDELVGLQEKDGKKSDEVASMVYVVMLRSILVKWDQPVTYCLLAGTKNIAQLNSWIDGVIASLLDIGFEVMALVTNQGSGFKKYATEVKCLSPQDHYFMINNKKIYYIFEFPQLLKCIRNNLGIKDISYNDKRISWQHIESLFELESKKTHKLIPKITSGHVTLCNITKMPSVRYAAEIFSNTVSRVIHTYVDIKEMPEEARDTADFCLFLNNLFDVLNSNTYKNDNVYKCSLGSDDSQMKLLQEAVNVFSTIEWKTAEYKQEKTKGNVKPLLNPRLSFPNVHVTLKSVIAISQDLNKLGYKRILTERLNLEPLEKFLDIVKVISSKKRVITKPSAIQFCRNFSKQFLKYIVTKSPLSNRPCAFREYFKDATLLKTNKISNISSRSPVLLGRGEIDYRIQLPEDHPTIYVASYIFHKCRESHQCKMLDYYADTLPDLSKTKVYDAYNKTAAFYGKLKLLNYTFTRYIEQLELAFTQIFQKSVRHPGSQAFNILRTIPLDPPCKCFPTDYAVKLLIRLRMYATIKAYNKRLKNQNMNLCKFISELNRGIK